jgi:hypothetical protein
MLFENILKNNDKLQSKKLIAEVDKFLPRTGFLKQNWEKVAEILEYPKDKIYINSEVSSHLIRTLNELKLLSIFGKHLHPDY